MTGRYLGRRVLPRAGAWVLTLGIAGCGLGDADDPEPAAALTQQAQHVGVALDIWSSSRGELATDVTPAVLDAAGVTLAEGVRATDFATVRSGGGTASSDDLWQFCLVGAGGSWVTYGDRSTVQAVGDAEEDACTFTGEPHPEPPAFDVRGLAHGVYDTMTYDDAEDEEESNLRVWGEGRTWGSNPKLRALVEERLPAGWTTSRVDQRGWSAVQYCITAPSGEWYYVRHSMVEGYDDVGRCRLDPDMRSSG